MRKLALLMTLLLTWTSASQAQLPELGGMYMGVAYTTNSNSYAEIEGGYLPGDQIDVSFFIPYTALQYDYEDSWWEYKMTPIYWDIVADITYAKDKGLAQTLFSSGILGHYLYGRNFHHGDRVRAGWGLGFGEYGLESGALEAGYYFTADLAAKADVLLTDSMVGRFRARYDISIGALPSSAGRVEDNKRAKPHFIALDFTLQTPSRLYLGIELWKIIPRNNDANRQIHFDETSHKYQAFRGIDPPATPPELSASRIQMHIGLKFYSVDDW